MPKDLPFMYKDISEREFIKWNLDYTMPWVIDCFKNIAEDKLLVKPRPDLNPPAWIVGHIAVTEHMHVGVVQGKYEIPDKMQVFHAGKEVDIEGVKAAGTRDDIIGYWESVRKGTNDYLDSISDEKLKELCPGKSLDDKDDGGEPNYYNPIREWFVMTIQHQNSHFGYLQVVAKLLADKG